MESDTVIKRLSALAHPGRLAVFRHLVAAGAPGVAAGEIAGALGVPANTLSAQLGILANAGLVVGRREGRSIIYAVDVAATRALLTYLVEDCCAGHPELCALDGLMGRGGAVPPWP